MENPMDGWLKDKRDLIQAIELDHDQFLKDMLANRNCSKQQIQDMIGAVARRGAEKCLRLLKARGELTPYTDQVLRWSAAEGHHGCVQMLLDNSTPEGRINALIAAAAGGHLECVKILFPRCTISSMTGSPLFFSVLDGHEDVMDYLIEHCGRWTLDEALQQARDNIPGTEPMLQLLEAKIEARNLRDTLHSVAPHKPRTGGRKI